MTSPTTPQGSSTITGRYHRRARNYLLDPRFQLKYTGLLVLVAVLLSSILGSQLWVMSREVIVQSQQAVKSGEQTVNRGKTMVEESRKVSDVVSMNISREYADNPELAALFDTDNKAREQKLAEEQRLLVRDAEALQQQARYLEAQHKKTLYILFGGLTVLVIAIGLAGIIFTHKIAGPVYKMTGLLRQVGEGKLKTGSGLRKGDELQAFFDTFVSMVESLRRHRSDEISRLDVVIADLEGSVDNARLAPLRALRNDLQEGLDR